jgi:hypothetical protein
MGMERFRHGDIEHHIPLNSYEVTTTMDLKLLMLFSFKIHEKNPCPKCIN